LSVVHLLTERDDRGILAGAWVVFCDRQFVRVASSATSVMGDGLSFFTLLTLKLIAGRRPLASA